MKYICELCGLVYDEEAGYPVRSIAPGTPFEALREDFSCPGCGSEKEAFTPVSKNQTVSAPQDSQFWQGIKYSDRSGTSDR